MQIRYAPSFQCTLCLPSSLSQPIFAGDGEAVVLLVPFQDDFLTDNFQISVSNLVQQLAHAITICGIRVCIHQLPTSQ